MQSELIANSRLAAPHNRLGIDYRRVPARKVLPEGGIIDAHTHAREPLHTQVMVDAARAYGITKIWTMAGLEHVRGLQEKFPGVLEFIAVPAWQRAFKEGATPEFLADWHQRVEKFYALGARLIKFHAAPGTVRKWGMDLDHPAIREVADHAYKLGYHMMTHVGDPRAWFHGNGRYADGTYAPFDQQFAQLDRFLERYPDRIHLGAHFGGSLEALDLLARRLDKYPHYIVDSSATKWIVRAASEQPAQGIRDFIIAYQDRILFGSDLVVGDKYDWDHYASRYWAHQKLWETDYRDQSPIEDPDAGKGFDPRTGTFNPAHADGVPRIVGLNLPAAVLGKMYRTNAQRWLPQGSRRSQEPESGSQ